MQTALIRDRLLETFRRSSADGWPAALVVRRDGQVIVDVASGVDRDGRPFTGDRPVLLYSAIKPVAALAVLAAVADGQLELDGAVADSWPAFAAGGKAGVTVRQALAHAAAVPGWRDPLPAAVLADRPAAAALLAAADPWWPIGEPGEHAISYGHLIDGILTAATGRDVVHWAARAVAATGTQLSLQPGAGDRAPAPLSDPGGRWRAQHLAAAGPMGALLRNPPELLEVGWMDGPAGRALVAPAVTGYGSAHDLARLWEWWTGDLAAEALGAGLRDASLSAQCVGHDHVLERPVAWGLGPQVEDGAVGMGGVGGCAGWHDRALGLSIGLTTCRVGAGDRFDALDEVIADLGGAPG